MRKYTHSVTKNNNESGNIFFALFGAIALVGIIGASTVAIMRGPLSTMVEVQSRTQAESEMAIASRLSLLEATQLTADGDCDADGFVEPLEFTDAGGAGPTGGGFLPSEVSSNRTDPWGTEYGYCAWDAGSITNYAGTGYPDTCDNGGGSSNGSYNRLAGSGSASDETYSIVAIISAGANMQFETTCTGGATPDVTKGGDDIVVEYTYESAVTATNGLWNIKTGEPGVAEIDKEIEVAGNIDLNRGGSGTGQLLLGAGSMIYPDQTVLTVCPGAANVNVGLIRMNRAASPLELEICDATGWVSVGGTGIWTAGTGDDIYYNQGTPQVGIGTTTPDNTLDVVGTFDVTGAVTFGNNLNVTGDGTFNELHATGDLSAGDAFFSGDVQAQARLTAEYMNINTTLNVIGAADFDSTLNVDGATTMSSTLFVQGDASLDNELSVNGVATFINDVDLQDSMSNSIGDILLDDAVDITGDLDIQGNVADSTGNLTLNDTVDITADLNVTSNLDVNGSADIDGTIEADDYTWNGNDFTPATCASGNFNRWDGTSWVCEDDIAGTSGGSTGTTGGIWENTSNLVRIKDSAGDWNTDDFVFGSDRLADVSGQTWDNARMYFDKSKGAFRAGYATTQWDDANVGQYSIALGFAGIAKGGFSNSIGYMNSTNGMISTALGDSNVVDGNYSTAIGSSNSVGTASTYYSHAFGNYNLITGGGSFAFGEGNTVGDAAASLGFYNTANGFLSTSLGTETLTHGFLSTAIGTYVRVGNGTASDGNNLNTGLGDFSMGIGLGYGGTGVYPRITGDSSLGIFMGDQSGYDLTTDNRMALVGGDFLIDDVGATGSNGCIRYSGATSRLQFSHDCTTWSDMVGASSIVGGSDTQVQYNDGGALAGDAGLTYDDTNNILTVGNAVTITGQAGNAPTYMNLDDLGDVDAASPANGECLVYNNGSGEWEAAACTSSGTAVLSGLTVATADNSINNAAWNQIWNWQLTGNEYGFLISENAASTGGSWGAQSLFAINTVASSTAAPLLIQNAGTNLSFAVADEASDTTPFVIGASGNVGIGTSNPYSKLHINGDTTFGGILTNSATSFDIVGNTNGAGSDINITGGNGSVSGGADPYPGGSVNITSGLGSFGDPDGNITLSVSPSDATPFGIMYHKINNTDLLTIQTPEFSDQASVIFGANTAIQIPSGTTAQRPDTPAAGMIRYNATTNKFEVYENGAWVNMISNGATDITSGVWEISSNVVRVKDAAGDWENDDFVFGSSQTADVVGQTWDDARMFFDKSKYAFRVGYAETQWDDANVGDGSISMGTASIASGQSSISIGDNNTASGQASYVFGIGSTATSQWSMALGTVTTASGQGALATGYSTTASGYHSTAMGHTTTTSGYNATTLGSTVRVGNGTASDGTSPGTGLGDYSMGIGLGLAAGTAPQVTGDSSLGIFMGDQSGYNLSTANRMALVGGHFMIDDAGATGSNGCIRYDGTTSKLQFSHDCTTFSDMTSGGAADVTSGIFEISSNVARVKDAAGDWAADDFVFGSPQLADDGDATHDNRFWFDKSKGAFRAGVAEGTEWDDANVGTASVAMGYRSNANGAYSTAIGLGARANAYGAVALGQNVTAGHTSGSGTYSVVLGQTVQTQANASMGIGLGAATGTYPIVSGVSSLGIFMGDQSGINLAAANTMSVMGGDLIVGSYQLDDTTTGNQDNRMFFDVSKGAFRAGYATGDHFDAANVGNYSAAFGERNRVAGQGAFSAGTGNTSSGANSTTLGSLNTASAQYSVALGYSATASGYQSLAWGWSSDASGNTAVAIGSNADAAGDSSIVLGGGNSSTGTGDYSMVMGFDSVASGLNSVLLGRKVTTTATATHSAALGLGNPAGANPQVSGDYSYGIFMGDQSAYDLTASNRMALVGGDFLIDDAGATGSNGCLRYDGTNSKLQFSHDCSTWSDMGSIASGVLALDDLSDAETDYTTDLNLFIGSNAGAGVIAGAQRNLAIGQNGMDATLTNAADDNTGVGYNTLTSLTSGAENTAFGSGALDAVTIGSYHTAVGYNALGATGSGFAHVAIGYNALGNMSGGVGYNIAVGAFSMSQATSGTANIGVGTSSLTYNYGDYNIALGMNALNENRAKSESTAIGYEAMRYADSTATTGISRNTALGAYALRGSTTASNNIGHSNTALGHSALLGNTEGAFNVAIGRDALTANTTGTDNLAAGALTMHSNTTGYRNVALGTMAMSQNVSGTSNIAVGYGALASSTNSNNIAIGDAAGDNLTAGSSNIFIGHGVDAPSTTGSNQLNIGNTIYGDLANDYIGIGDFSADTIDSTLHLTSGDIRLDGGAGNQAGCMRYDDTTDKLQFSHDCSTYADMGALSGALAINDLSDAMANFATDGNMFIGHEGSSVTTGSGIRNLGIGYTAADSLTTGDENVAIGRGALTTATTQSDNTAIGNYALYYAASSSNTAIGSGAMRYYAGTGSYNTAVGASAGPAVSGGLSASGNVSLGYSALTQTTAGDDNVAIGGFALNSNQAKQQSTAVGYSSMRHMDETTTETPSYNSALGYNSLRGATTDATLNTGTGNTAIGHTAIRNITSGNNNTALGYLAGDTISSGSNNIALGYNADFTDGTASNQLNIGNTIYGDLSTNQIAIGTATQTTNIQFKVSGTGGIIVPSGTTAQRPTAIETGMFRYNTTATPADTLEYYDAEGATWRTLLASGAGAVSAIDDLSDAITNYTDANMYLGSGNGDNTTTGVGNTALGNEALAVVTTAQGTTAVGRNALTALETGNGNSAFGNYALSGLNGGNDNTAVGGGAGGALLGGQGNTAIGSTTMYSPSTRSYNTAVGFSAMEGGGSGGYNTALGVYALQSNSGKAESTAVGYGAMRYSDDAAANSVSYNTAVGAYALQGSATAADNTGTSNTAIGHSALMSNTNGSTNIAIGASALKNHNGDGNSNIAIGVGSMEYSDGDSMDGNVGIGYGALNSNDGQYNVGIGYSAMISTNSNDSVAIGSEAMGNIGSSGGSNSVALGTRALHLAAGADRNVALGFQSGNSLTTGDDNILIGYDVDAPSATSSSQLNIGNTIYGDLATDRVAIGTSSQTADAQFKVAGTGSIMIPTGTNAQRPATGAAGMIRYNTDATTNDRIEYYDAESAAWIQLPTSSSSSSVFEVTGGAGTELVRQVAASAPLLTSDFVFGSTQLADTGNADHDSRMFFDKSKGAFRAGSTPGSEWDDANIGLYSVAIGSDVTASGDQSVAIGSQISATAQFGLALGNSGTTATGYGATAIGWGSSATNTRSVAIGTNTLSSGAGSYVIGTDASASGDYSLALGLGTAAGTSPIISGTNSVGIFMGDQSGVNLADANTVSIMGASGGVGIGTVTPVAALDVVGNIRHTGIMIDASDIRYKTDIHYLPEIKGNILDRITQIKGYTYRMKDDKKGQIEYGVIAQELERVFPELVVTDDTPEKMKSVNYVGLIAPLIEATKELKSENDALKAKMDAYDARFAALEKDMDSLKIHTGFGISQASMGLLGLLTLITISGIIVVIRRKGMVS